MGRMIFGESFLASLWEGISHIKLQNSLSRCDIKAAPNDILANEVIHPNDERNYSEISDKARKDEIRGLNSRNTCLL